MSVGMDKNYNPREIEDRLYDKWMRGHYFAAHVNHKKKPFCIVMPPPNITGRLHMGHALDNTLQDILIRCRRMQGYEALWQPGTDHASIATEVRIINMLKEKGISKEQLGRDGFLKEAWKWKDEYGGRIVSQLKKLGSSADWERERFTMDEGCSAAVREVFCRLYEKGHIYRGPRIINWCPVCRTTISDAEVEHREISGHFWHIRYPIAGEDGFVEIATTRPETMLGDTAVAVNPSDERYRGLVGKQLILPLTGRTIPVIADEYVDMEFGTGCVKITPAHDPNDFEVGRRHGLEEICIMNDDATINENGGRYAGLDRYEARKTIVEDLKQQGLLVCVKDHAHNVGTHDRCRTIVEPMVKKQWFVSMERLKVPAMEAIKKGELKFVPEYFDKTYLHWLEGIHDWCISRQLWWGHRIPAWHCADCGHVTVSRTDPTKCEKCQSPNITQDPDTLDTWFSSALWPFSTLGWPQKTQELEYFYPTDVLVTGYDIIFFWVVRMVFSGYEQMGASPFKTVFIHGLVRDEQGRKMSKSLGNGIDPLDVIEKYGADALRLALVTGNSPGNDMRFARNKMEAARNFANKVWNASRFVMMNTDGIDISAVTLDMLLDEDRWILSAINSLASEVTANIDKFELGVAIQKIYDFIWDEYCDWYIEMAKPRFGAGAEDDGTRAAAFTLRTVLIQALKLLHPFMPFITEEIFCSLQSREESIMISKWPEFRKDWDFSDVKKRVDIIKDAIRAIRNIRTQMNVPPSKKTAVHVVSQESCVRDAFISGGGFFAKLASASNVHVSADRTGIGDDAVSCVVPCATIYIPLEDLVDVERERVRLEKEKKRLQAEIARCEGMLKNEKFVLKAPAHKVNEEKEKLSKYKGMAAQLEERLAQL